MTDCLCPCRCCLARRARAAPGQLLGLIALLAERPEADPARPRPSQMDLPADWQERDALGSYNEAIAAIGAAVKAGAPVPEFMRWKDASE